MERRRRSKIDRKIQFAAFAGYVGLRANGHRFADVSVRLYRSFSDHRLAALIRIFFGDCASYFTTTYFSSLSYGQRPAEFSISLAVALSLRPSSPTFLPFPSLPFPIFPSPPFVLRSRSLFFPFFIFSSGFRSMCAPPSHRRALFFGSTQVLVVFIRPPTGRFDDQVSGRRRGWLIALGRGRRCERDTNTIRTLRRSDVRCDTADVVRAICPYVASYS